MTLRSALKAALLSTLIAPLGCKRTNTVPTGLPNLNLKSSSFSDGGAIPNQFVSCEGQPDDSPELSWQSPPANTQSFVLIVTDPDAPIGNFVHWVLYNIPPDTRELPQAIRKEEQTPNGSRQGVNDFDEIGYDGPCPPGHSTHRYVFDLYALDTKLNLPAGATKRQVSDAIYNHILAHGQLTGRYQR
jgi:Raf kinase inhibitor-like YbhB/YbcL family protein